MEWSLLSKPADRSNRESREMWLTSRATRRLFTIFKKGGLSDRQTEGSR